MHLSQRDRIEVSTFVDIIFSALGTASLVHLHHIGAKTLLHLSRRSLALWSLRMLRGQLHLFQTSLAFRSLWMWRSQLHLRQSSLGLWRLRMWRNQLLLRQSSLTLWSLWTWRSQLHLAQGTLALWSLGMVLSELPLLPTSLAFWSLWTWRSHLHLPKNLPMFRSQLHLQQIGPFLWGEFSQIHLSMPCFWPLRGLAGEVLLLSISASGAFCLRSLELFCFCFCQKLHHRVHAEQRTIRQNPAAVLEAVGKIGKSQRNSKVGSKLPNQKQPLQREDAKFKTSFSPFLNGHSCGFTKYQFLDKHDVRPEELPQFHLVKSLSFADKKSAKSLVFPTSFLLNPPVLRVKNPNVWCLHRIGRWENLQESPIFDGKTMVSCKCSLKPIQWCLNHLNHRDFVGPNSPKPPCLHGPTEPDSPGRWWRCARCRARPCTRPPKDLEHLLEYHKQWRYDMIWYDMIWCDVMWCDMIH